MKKIRKIFYDSSKSSPGVLQKTLLPNLKLDRSVYFRTALVLLALTLLASFFLKGTWAWVSGLIYISYDTGLILFVSCTVFKINKLKTVRSEESKSDQPECSIAILVPARNEGHRLPACIQAIFDQSELPDEIHVIDDGSDDGFDIRTLNQAGKPEIQIHIKPQSGKANSLNLFWPTVKSDVVVTLDADTLLERNAIAAIRREFTFDPLLATGGGVLVPIRGDQTGLQARVFEFFQHFEYIRAFLSRRAWMEKNALLLVSGAFAAYRKTVLLEVGGYDERSLVEDYELIHRIHRYSFENGRNYKVQILPTARALTDAPTDVVSFLKQRRRWFGGFIQTHFRYGKMIGNSRYGKVGTLMLPIKSLDTLQPVYGGVAFFTLLYLILSHQTVRIILLNFIAFKLVIDLVFHFVSIHLYYYWAGLRIKKSEWALAVLSTLLEPFSFQLLRHAGAIWGWFEAFRSQNEWIRPDAAKPAVLTRD